jgi:site-specific recombinase XerD
MKVQRAIDPDTNRHRWLVLDHHHLPVEPIRVFLFYLESVGKSPNTIRAYAHHLKLFWVYLDCAGKEWTVVGLQELAGFVGWLRTAPTNSYSLSLRPQVRTDSTVNAILAAVSTFYDFHWRNDQVKGIPLYRYLDAPLRRYKSFLHHVNKGKPILTNLLKQKANRSLPRVISREQVAKLLGACGNLRDRLLVSLLYETGMRIGSALGLRHEDVRSWDLTISIVPRPDNADWARAKGMEPCQLQVTSELMRLYADYLVHEFQETDCDHVFVNLWKEPKGQPMTYSAVADLFRRLSKKVGFDVHPHLLRHTHGTELVRHGLDVLTVQKRLGHQSIQTTQKYVHLSASDLNEAVRDFQRKKGGQS